MANYFSSLPHRLKVQELGKCDFMQSSEFADGVKKLTGKKSLSLVAALKAWPRGKTCATAA